MDFKFNCNICNYNTNKSSDFIKHYKTRKHLNNCQNNILIKENICNICNL